MKKSNMLKYLLVLMLAFAGTRASAQVKPAAERASDLTESMNCELGLLASQLSKINAINLEACLGMDAASVYINSDISSYHRKGISIDKKRNTELRDALTWEQFAVYERISKNNQHLLKKTANCREDVMTKYGSCSF